jgi:UDP-sugar transporter A1/2/3
VEIPFCDSYTYLGLLKYPCLTQINCSASIYFEKVIKLDPLQLTIWERNFQLALGSVPVYFAFIFANGGGSVGFGGGWSLLALAVATLGAAGGILVALSIKYADSILKTLATTSAIVLSSILDKIFLNGPLTPIMGLAGIQVIISICQYTFDQSVESDPVVSAANSSPAKKLARDDDLQSRSMDIDEEEQIALIDQTKREE